MYFILFQFSLFCLLLVSMYFTSFYFKENISFCLFKYFKFKLSGRAYKKVYLPVLRGNLFCTKDKCVFITRSGFFLRTENRENKSIGTFFYKICNEIIIKRTILMSNVCIETSFHNY